MSWDRILQLDAGDGTPLRSRIDDLFAQQRATWPALRDGEASLRHLRTKTLTASGDQIVVQFNPGRQRSTHAKTDAQSIATRPCFLCPANMPPEERGVAFEDLVVLPNPFPIAPFHCTVAGREHRPQQLAGRVDTLLRLAAAIGPDLAALYNGPRCGASAPDHFHFQACRADAIPILARLPIVFGNRHCAAHSSFGRSMLIFADQDADWVQSGIEQAIQPLSRLPQNDDEPMFNLLVQFVTGRFVVVLFPRRAHRPSCYFAAGDAQLAISPAVLEMAGLLITTDPDDFQRVDAATAKALYAEVSWDAPCCELLAAR